MTAAVDNTRALDGLFYAGIGLLFSAVALVSFAIALDETNTATRSNNDVANVQEVAGR